MCWLPFHAGSDGYPHPTAVYIEDEQKWEVSGVLQHKGSVVERKYLIVYSGCDKSKAFWLPKSDLSRALKIMNDYKVSHGFLLIPHNSLSVVYHLICLALD